VNSFSRLIDSARAQFASYDISPLSLSFKQPKQEAEYQAFVYRTTIVSIRIALALSIILIVSFGLVDARIYQARDELAYALAIRYLMLLPPPLLLLVTTYHFSYITAARFAGGAVTCIVGAGFSLCAYKSNTLTLVYTFPALVEVTAYAFVFTGLFFRHAFVAGVIANAIYSLAAWTAEIPFAMGIAVEVSLVTIFLLLAAAAYQKELLSRRLFVSDAREREAALRQSQSDRRYLAWLRQLAQFLRHEVRQPLAQISSSIEVARMAIKSDDTVGPYLASAALGTQHVWNLVERASQATDAEAFVRDGRPALIDLRKLLMELVPGFASAHSGIEFTLQCAAPVIVRGDATLIKEAVSNLLSNATSFADEASAVKVAVEADTAHAVIKVSNKGPSIEGDAETLFGPFASTRSGPSSEHHGLGLYLVRLIAEQHGGTATIANMNDGSGVEASIALPTGAQDSSTQR
jgi:signal transduction histidine kinase